MLESNFFKRLELQLLLNLTAGAFGQEPKRIWTRPSSQALQYYAQYTAENLCNGASPDLIQCMNSRAYRLGRLLRILFLVRSEARAQRLIAALYRNIGIRLSYEGSQNICFHRCYFSKHYTPAACLAASALDDGIIRGISGLPAHRLCFSQRITEGCSCCRATLLETTKEI